ncbi:P-loop containing nucleoside triphosphate hydrolase protein, partial [Parasitella parasitica]
IVSITLIFDSIVLVTRAIVEQFWTSTVLAYYIAVSWFSWSLCIITLITEAQSNHNKWYWVQYAFWFLAVAMETIVGWYWLRGITKHLPGTVFTIYDYFFLGVFITRYIVEWIIFVLSIIHLSKSRPTVAESSPLLVGSTTVYSQQQHQYGSTKMTTITTTITRTESAFSGSIRNMKKLLPFIWPHNNLKLQLCVLLSFFTIGLGLAVNLLVPFKIGRIVDDLRDGQFSWLPIVAYIGFKSLQGDTGLFQSIQNWLWAPISQHITQDVSLKVFSHLHISSVGFHTNRKTGEVQRVMEQGANSVVSLLHQILFQIFPIWANIILVSFFAAYIYAPAFGLLIFVAAMFYMNVTIAATERMAEYDQNIVELDKNTCTRAASSLANVETVKCYNAENFEHARYKDAIVSCQQADRKSSASLNTLNLIQNAIITGSLLSGSLWIGYQVSIGQLESGDFVAFNIYMMQIFTPLHHIGTHYRMVQTNFIRMEKMLTFLQEDQTIKDTPNAKELQVSQGHVVFDNVTFAQRERQNALNGISFSIPKGATVAFVGPASGGKSAVLRLLFRFHDPLSGHIYIDGQDIGQVTQSSLRKNIGIMPKDTVLFNESIYYNIHYGNVNADESQVKMAAKAAQFHDKIESFPDGYETKVGEQGLCLTTSDKQRIAIARTFLKNAPIILLDTSALDVTTEGRTLQALSSMTKDRTTLIVTHRLASVVNADLIFVVKDGMVVEKGSHQQLMEKTTAINGGGIYYKMWQKQIHD